MASDDEDQITPAARDLAAAIRDIVRPASDLGAMLRGEVATRTIIETDATHAMSGGTARMMIIDTLSEHFVDETFHNPVMTDELAALRAMGIFPSAFTVEPDCFPMIRAAGPGKTMRVERDLEPDFFTISMPKPWGGLLEELRDPATFTRIAEQQEDEPTLRPGNLWGEILRRARYSRPGNLHSSGPSDPVKRTQRKAQRRARAITRKHRKS